MIMDFRETFCQALSLACNTMVMFDYFWDYSAADVFRSNDVEQKIWYLGPIGESVEAGQSEIEVAKRLYKILEIFDQKPVGQYDEKTKRIFWIAIERWRKSKTHQNYEDQIIDLGIALESLYLSGTESKNEIRFRFSLHAAWHLGEDKEHREGLMKKFKAIYDWRSAVVHTGKLPEKGKGKKKKSYTQSEVREFIRSTQDLCQKSIVKILKKYSEDGKYPDDDYWNNLILG